MTENEDTKGGDPRFVNHRIRFPRELHEVIQTIARENRWSFNTAMVMAAEMLAGHRYDPTSVANPARVRGPRVGKPPVESTAPALGLVMPQSEAAGFQVPDEGAEYPPPGAASTRAREVFSEITDEDLETAARVIEAMQRARQK